MVTYLPLGSSEHRHLRELGESPSSNRPKQHYTYQYMSYSDSLNHTITTSVSIRVTPLEDYLVSWSILWFCFVVASIIAAWQVYREQRIFKLRHAAAGSRSGHEDESAVDVALADGESVSTADLTRSLVRFIRHDRRQLRLWIFSIIDFFQRSFSFGSCCSWPW
jgi:hypothetical protein